MSNMQQLEILKQGVTTWNQWRRNQQPETEIDLSDVELRGINLDKINLSGANLGGTDFREASLREADLSSAILNDSRFGNADLYKANFSRSILWWANFWQANIEEGNFSEAELWHVNFTNTNLLKANLNKADLTSAVLVETNFEEARLSDAIIYGISAWNLNLEGAVQNNLVITQPLEPQITVDDLEIAQFIYLMLNHKKLRNALNAVTERGVLILGRFAGGGLELLQSIASKLREKKYLPIIFDFDRPTNRDYTETVKTLVGLSRFVIVDLSGPSVPQELYATVPFFDIPFVPITAVGKKNYSMFVDLLKYQWVIKPPYEFQDKNHLLEILLPDIVKRAEEKHEERQALLEELFPNRSGR